MAKQTRVEYVMEFKDFITKPLKETLDKALAEQKKYEKQVADLRAAYAKPMKTDTAEVKRAHTQAIAAEQQYLATMTALRMDYSKYSDSTKPLIERQEAYRRNAAKIEAIDKSRINSLRAIEQTYARGSAFMDQARLRSKTETENAIVDAAKRANKLLESENLRKNAALRAAALKLKEDLLAIQNKVNAKQLTDKQATVLRGNAVQDARNSRDLIKVGSDSRVDSIIAVKKAETAALRVILEQQIADERAYTTRRNSILSQRAARQKVFDAVRKQQALEALKTGEKALKKAEQQERDHTKQLKKEQDQQLKNQREHDKLMLQEKRRTEAADARIKKFNAAEAAKKAKTSFNFGSVKAALGRGLIGG